MTNNLQKTSVFIATVLTNFILFFSFIYPGAIAPLMMLVPQNAGKAMSLLSIYGAFVLGFVARPLGSLVFGWTADRFGKIIVTRSSLLCCLASLVVMTFFTPNLVAFSFLIIARILQGATLGGQIHSSLANFYEVFFKNNTRVSCGTLTAVNLLGSMAAVICSEIVNAETWKWPLYGAMLMTVFVFVVSEFTTKTTQEKKLPQQEENSKNKAFSLSKGSFLAFAIQAFPYFIFYQTIIYSTYEHAQQILNLKILFSILLPCSLLTFCALDRYLPKRPALIISMIAGSSGLALNIFGLHNPWTDLFFVILMAVSIAGYLSTLMDILPSFFPKKNRVMNLAIASEASSIVFAGALPYCIKLFKVPLLYPYILLFLLTIYLLRVVFLTANKSVQ